MLHSRPSDTIVQERMIDGRPNGVDSDALSTPRSIVLKSRNVLDHTSIKWLCPCRRIAFRLVDCLDSERCSLFYQAGLRPRHRPRCQWPRSLPIALSFPAGCNHPTWQSRRTSTPLRTLQCWYAAGRSAALVRLSLHKIDRTKDSRLCVAVRSSLRSSVAPVLLRRAQ